MADEEDEGVMVTLHGYNEVFLHEIVEEVQKDLREEDMPEDELVEATVDRLKLIAQKLAFGSKKPPPMLQKG